MLPATQGIFWGSWSYSPPLYAVLFRAGLCLLHHVPLTLTSDNVPCLGHDGEGIQPSLTTCHVSSCVCPSASPLPGSAPGHLTSEPPPCQADPSSFCCQLSPPCLPHQVGLGTRPRNHPPNPKAAPLKYSLCRRTPPPQNVWQGRLLSPVSLSRAM